MKSETNLVYFWLVDFKTATIIQQISWKTIIQQMLLLLLKAVELLNRDTNDSDNNSKPKTLLTSSAFITLHDYNNNRGALYFI